MGVREGCFLLGAAFLRIGMAAELAAWANNRKRPDEVAGFLQQATIDIYEALASDFITPGEVNEMTNCIDQHEEAVKRGDRKKAQDALALLAGRATDMAFQMVVKCEARPRGEE